MIDHKIHKYYRVTNPKTKNSLYRCAIAGCSHYTFPFLVVGRKTICWKCGEETIVRKDKDGVRMKPKCANCTGRKAKVITKMSVDTSIEAILKEIDR